MAKRPSQTRDDTACSLRAGGSCPSEVTDRRRREKEDIKVECGFENVPVTPREIELLGHYLGAEIDEILRDEG